HEGQPFYTSRSLYGLYNQVDFLRRAGALTVQVTVHTPAVGTREYEATYASGRVLKALGRYELPESVKDGNHVIVAGREPAWLRQLKMLGGYAAFYNPLNLLRACRKGKSRLRTKQIDYQCLGILALLWTAVRLLPYIVRLLLGRATFHQSAPPASDVPVLQAAHAPARSLPPRSTNRRTGTRWRSTTPEHIAATPRRTAA
ncbi:MAG: hypothetical protein NZO58_12805, partial [Gemmataceae bacterium]|nr:hypothetical protein [Gemmataceae bacterium]